MPVKKLVASLVVVIVAVGGFVAGLMLLQERQNINEKAAVPGGQATVTLSPATGSYKVGDTIKATVYFQTANIAISGVAVRLTYPFTGIAPELSVQNIAVNQTFLTSGNWTCPTQSSSLQGGNVVIDIGCGTTAALGYKTNTNTLFATIDLKVDRAPSTSPLVIKFDPDNSIITKKSDNTDILLIPTSVGSYTIGGGTTPTVVASGSPSPTSRLTLTPTRRVSATPTGEEGEVTLTPTEASLDGAGVSFPTVVGLLIGVLLIGGALVLAL